MNYSGDVVTKALQVRDGLDSRLGNDWKGVLFEGAVSIGDAVDGHGDLLVRCK